MASVRILGDLLPHRDDCVVCDGLHREITDNWQVGQYSEATDAAVKAARHLDKDHAPADGDGGGGKLRAIG
jgi:hypothetical protein